MRTSDLRNIILKTFREKEFYGYDIHKKLVSEGLSIELGRLYKVLNQMLRDEWLESTWEKSVKGPKKKLYKLGKKGKEELNRILINAIRTIHKAYGEYLLSLPPERSVFRIITQKIVGNQKGQFAVVLVAESASPMYRRLLKGIREMLPDVRIYVVKPKSLILKMELENIVYLEGSLENIPLKNNYVDILITTNLPRNENIENSTKEWRRAIKKTGRMTLLSPNVLFAFHQDPLTIGDFMEKWEHEIYENRKAGEGKVLLDSLRNHFSSVEEINVVHMKLILAKNLP